MKSLQMMMMGKKSVSGFGLLYNYPAVRLANFAPTDWIFPSTTQFETLMTYLGGQIVAGGKMKESGYDRWNSPNSGADNSSGFTGVGAGSRDSVGNYSYFKNRGCNVCSDDYDTNNPYIGFLYNNFASFQPYSSNTSITCYSVKLLWNGTGSPGSTLTDYDGNVIDIKLIGTQYWTVQNWKCTHLTDGTLLTLVTGNTEWAALTMEGYCYPNGKESNV